MTKRKVCYRNKDVDDAEKYLANPSADATSLTEYKLYFKMNTGLLASAVMESFGGQGFTLLH